MLMQMCSVQLPGFYKHFTSVNILFTLYTVYSFHIVYNKVELHLVINLLSGLADRK